MGGWGTVRGKTVKKNKRERRRVEMKDERRRGAMRREGMRGDLRRPGGGGTHTRSTRSTLTIYVPAPTANGNYISFNY